MQLGKLNIGSCLALAVALLWGCTHQPVQGPSAPSDAGFLAARYAITMVGTPYRYGGNTPGGFDCSGLVHYSYARAGFTVPRTTRQQRKYSRRVVRNELRPGDLLFFNQNGKHASHVGLYIGDSRFVHAPSSGKHVYVSMITSRYWRRHFTEARRFHLER